MPCESMSGYASGYDTDARRRLDKLERERVSASALLCSACRALADYGYDFEMNPALSVWWDAHQKEDAEREKREAGARLRAEAAKATARKPFAELTDADLQLLYEEGYLQRR